VERGRGKTDGISFITSLLINLIIFSLAFVYVAGGQPPGKTAVPPTQDESPESEISIMVVPEPLDILPPADFVNEPDGKWLDEEAFEYPRFKQIFDSYQLPPPYRGNEYLVTVKLDIDIEGHLASEPDIIVSSGEKEVDEETIRRLKKIRYTPARTSADGELITAILTTKIFWYPGGG
jgi:hypothetical protein